MVVGALGLSKTMRELALRGARGVLALVFVTQFVALELAFHGALRGGFGAAASSTILWSALVFLVRASLPGRFGVALLAATLLTLQSFVFRVVHVPLDVQVAEAARHSFGVIRSVIVTALPGFLVTVGAAFGLEWLLLAQASRFACRLATRLRGPAAGIATAGTLAVTASVVALPLRESTPDLRALASLGVLRREPPVTKAGAVSLAALHSSKATVPDVLFILTESVRSSDYVASGSEATASVTHGTLPRRFDLRELRSISSYTAVSLSALITGRTQDGRREDVLGAPNLFDFAHALGANVGFYSAQSRETFETKDVRASVDRFFTLETIAGHDIEDDAEWVKQPLDRMVIDRFIGELGQRSHPSVTMLQLYGTHAPYYFEDAEARFSPWSRSVAWADMPKLRNAYRNAIRTQDAQLARAINAFVQHARGRPWFIVFTSDHGEAFGEHSAIHHGQNLYDEQLHVPAWIAAGGGALTLDDEHVLERKQAHFATHLDILPTILDVLGVLENFSVAPYRASWKGESLLRENILARDIPITNCTAMFPCPVNTWGLLRGDHKLIAQAWDGAWRCMALAGGEHEVGLEEPSCQALLAASRRVFDKLPNGTLNRP